MKLRSNQKGFTLIEILVVIGIIAVLAAIVLIAINPARQFRQARDSQRDSNVNAVLNAVGQFTADNKGDLPTGIPTGDSSDPNDYDEVSDTGADLCSQLVPTYIPALPVDPTTGDEGIDDCSVAYSTGYLIIQDSTTSRITVLAPNTEERSPDIQVTR